MMAVVSAECLVCGTKRPYTEADKRTYHEHLVSVCVCVLCAMHVGKRCSFMVVLQRQTYLRI